MSSTQNFLLISGIAILALSCVYLTLPNSTIEEEVNLTKGFTTDFKDWLNNNGYGSFKFDRPDLAGSCYG